MESRCDRDPQDGHPVAKTCDAKFGRSSPSDKDPPGGRRSCLRTRRWRERVPALGRRSRPTALSSTARTCSNAAARNLAGEVGSRLLARAKGISEEAVVGDPRVE